VVVLAPATAPAPPTVALPDRVQTTALPNLTVPDRVQSAPPPRPTEPAPAATEPTPAATEPTPTATEPAPRPTPIPRAKPQPPLTADKSPVPPVPAATAPTAGSTDVAAPARAAPEAAAVPAASAENPPAPAIGSSVPAPPTVAAVTSVGPLTGGAALPADRGAMPLGGSANAPPRYPYLARARAQEGQVVVRVEVDAAGGVRSVAVARSSGFAMLDEAALGAVRRWRFEPARRSGVAVAATLDVPISFRLTDR
jgi:protein TonB